MRPFQKNKDPQRQSATPSAAALLSPPLKGVVPRLRGTGGCPQTRGAALIVALAILVILTTIGLSFFVTTRLERRVAESVADTTRAEHIANAGLAMAMSFLAHDLNIHHTFTSTDHAWKTYFNGAAFVGKPWLWEGGQSIAEGGVPRLNLTPQGVTPAVQNALNKYRLEGFGDRLYIPRFQPADKLDPEFFDDFAADPDLRFVTAAEFDPASGLFPNEQIHQWADVDNDGDGLRDSIWIPVPKDIFFGGIYDDKGELLVPGDGIDNDLDGEIDEQGETAVFLYWSREARRIFLTTPIFLPDPTNLSRPNLNNPVTTIASPQNAVNTALLREYDPAGTAGLTDPDIVSMVANPVFDTLDNDHDLVINNAEFYYYVANIGPASPQWNPTDLPQVFLTDGIDNNLNGLTDAADGRLEAELALEVLRRSYHVINPIYTGTAPLILTSTGEPVCEIVGRVAVLINDESAKVNLNAAGGHVAYQFPGDVNPSLVRAISQGLGPHEYDTRVLPGIGNAISRRMWEILTGGGAAIVADAANANELRAYQYDASLPGYGFVDDDGNILAAIASRLDTSGRATLYQSDGVDNDGNGLIDEPGEGIETALAQIHNPLTLPGIDDPGEYRAFRPIRNLVAENELAPLFAAWGDPRDVDGDFAASEYGELGDNILRTREQLGLVNGINTSGPSYTNLEPIVSLHSTGKDVALQQRALIYDDATLNPASYGSGPVTTRTISGFKLDYNFASPAQIANALIQNFGFQSSVYPGGLPTPAIAAFTRGLRRADVATFFYNDPDNPYSVVNAWQSLIPPRQFPYIDPVSTFPELIMDAELRARQIAVNLRDHRDPNHARSTIESQIIDDWWGTLTGEERPITYTQAGVESIRINEIMVRPVRRIEAEMLMEFTPIGFRDAYEMLGLVRTTPAAQNRVMRYDPNLFFRNEVGVDQFRLEVRTSADRPDTPQDDGFFPYPDIFSPTPWTGPWGDDARYIGPHAGISQTGPAFIQNPLFPGVPGAPQFIENLIEFHIRVGAPSVNPADKHLPPGRYYLTANTLATIVQAGGIYGVPTVTQSNQLRYHISEGASIIPAVQAGLDLSNDANYGVAQVSTRLAIQDQGTVFLPDAYADGQRPFVDPDENGSTPPAARSDGYAMELKEGMDLFISFWGDIPGLTINYLEFTQEPDHEWVEIVNVAEYDPAKPVAEQLIDISGWRLEVGLPGNANVFGNSDHYVFDVPTADPVYIAPGGSLLLAVDKFDRAHPTVLDDHPNGRRIWKENGIGLASGTAYAGGVGEVPSFGQVTTPPIIFQPNPLSGFIGQSVFARGATYQDFVDRNGDGIDDRNTLDYRLGAVDLASLTPPHRDTDYNGLFDEGRILDDLIQSTRDREVAAESGATAKAWDRIVQLQENALTDALSLDSVLFEMPNELQRLADLVLQGGVFPNYPEHDGIDNDGDRFVLGLDLVDNNGNGIIDDTIGLDPIEGIDEGRFAGSLKRPGSFSEASFPYTVVMGVLDPTIAGNEYLGTRNDPPEWKEFLERRWYPGDCVFVTLKDPLGRIVDQVTYTENDVINRAIDDSVVAGERRPVLAIPQDSTGALVREPLDGSPTSWYAAYRGFWPDNTMGLDFYRSLERKHPVYPGDRFGTQNRWQATDGAYDDWDRSELPRDDAGNLIYATPLSKNAATKRLEGNSPGAVWAIERGDWRGYVRNNEFISSGSALTAAAYQMYTISAGTLVTPSVGVPRVVFAPQDQIVTGVLLGQGSPADLTAVLETGVSSPVILSAAQADFLPLNPSGSNLQARRLKLAWAPVPQAWAPVFTYSFPNEHVDNDTGNPRVLPPGAAGPEPNIDISDDIAPGLDLIVSLFNAPDTATLASLGLATNGADLAKRWPLFHMAAARPGPQPRALMYVSANTELFDHTSPRARYFDPNLTYGNSLQAARPAEAMFFWDGDDGLENGQYEAYIITAEPLDRLATSQALTTFAAGAGGLLDRADDEIDNRLLPIDAEFFTDYNGEWESVPGLGQYLNPSAGTVRVPGALGMVTGIQPDDLGVAYYGVVEVKNNRLALRLRNYAQTGRLNRFSRVVLTPKFRTRGRININTAESRDIAQAGTQLFNPLVGIPGVLMNFDTAEHLSSGRNSFFNPIAPAPNLILDPPGRAFAVTYPSDLVLAMLDTNPPPLTAMSRAMQRARLITSLRPEFLDGRYYRYTGDLVSIHDPVGLGTLGLGLVPDERVAAPAFETDGGPYALPGVARGVLNNTESNEARQLRFEDIAFRFERMDNLISTRSDVFEIIVTAQSGFVIDNDGDGLLNHRGRDFVVTGEKKIRVVYER